MRRIAAVGMIILGLVAVPLIAAAKPAPEKVEICHVTGDGGAHTIKVSERAVAAHLAHDDYQIDDQNTAEACGVEITSPDPDEATPPPVVAAFVVTNITCNFFSRCLLTVDASGSEGATYDWMASNGQESDSATGAVAIIGPFEQDSNVAIQLTVTDGSGITDSSIQTILAVPTP